MGHSQLVKRTADFRKTVWLIYDVLFNDEECFALRDIISAL